MENEKYLCRLVGKKFMSNNLGTSTTIPIIGKDEKNDTKAIFAISNVLDFEDYRLHINNPISIVPSGNELNELIGSKVISTDERENEAEIVFDNGSKLFIDMRDEVYYGPEAMCLYGPDDFCAVWN